MNQNKIFCENMFFNDAVPITDFRIDGKNNFFNRFLNFEFFLQHETSTFGTFLS